MTPQLISGDNFQKEVLDHKGVVFVDFYADWCAPCKMTEPIIEELAVSDKYKDNVKFIKIDVDADQEIASQYNVFSIPTFVTFVNGEVQNQFSGARDKTSFEAELDKSSHR
jgi:thioredoxin 1